MCISSGSLLVVALLRGEKLKQPLNNILSTIMTDDPRVFLQQELQYLQKYFYSLMFHKPKKRTVSVASSLHPTYWNDSRMTNWHLHCYHRRLPT